VIRHDSLTTLSAVSLSPGAIGAHVGILYASGADGTRHLHLAFHHQLTVEPWDRAGPGWISPGYLDPLGAVRTLAALVASRHADGEVAYALDPADAQVDSSSGEVRLNQSIGLTCSTFILRLFTAAGLPLVDESTWATRSAARIVEDTKAQETLVSFLEKRDEAHAARVRQQIGCTRIRAEEVAYASSSMAQRPAQLANIEEASAALMRSLNVSSDS